MGRFDNEELQRAAARCSPYVDRAGPLGYYQLEETGTIDVVCSTCLYVWVRGNQCMYIGQVRRRGPTGVADRFARHHRQLECYDGVWVIPMLPSISPALLNTYERLLITLYAPVHNRVARRSPA